jgi:hypothetical protein
MDGKKNPQGQTQDNEDAHYEQYQFTSMKLLGYCVGEMFQLRFVSPSAALISKNDMEGRCFWFHATQKVFCTYLDGSIRMYISS